MRILFLGDVVGNTGCKKIKDNLLEQIKLNKIDFVIVNGENAADEGVGLTKEICENFFESGVNVITTGNHVWDKKDIMKFIDNENRLLVQKICLSQPLVKDFKSIILQEISEWEYLI